MIVMKFGGTSTQDAHAMANVSRIVTSRYSQQPIIVISAIAGATNSLEKIGALAAEGKRAEALDVMTGLLERHHVIVRELIKQSERNAALLAHLSSSRNELEDLIKGVSILRELTPRTLDTLYAFGELLSSRLIAAVLQEQGVNAQWVDTKDFMLTDENFNNALPLMEEVESRLSSLVLPLVRQGIVPVTQGYIGVTETGRRTTMGRESSDYSAAVIGAAMNVDDIQIWTDVDGILTADPRVVAVPMKVKRLSFEEAFELSFFGAKVLHPNTMLPAIAKNIPIHIYNSRQPQRSGTQVISYVANDKTVLKSIAYKKNVTVLTVVPKKRYNQFVFWEHLYTILTKHGATPSMTVTSEYSIAFVLDAKNAHHGIIHEMNDFGICEVLENKAILCLVGANVRQSPKLMERLFSAIPRERISMVSFGASRHNISMIVDVDHIHEAVINLHKEFFSKIEDADLFELLEQPSSSAM
jgi:aspartate kinase